MVHHAAMTLDRALELLMDTDSVAGLAVTSVAVVLIATAIPLIAAPFVRRRFADDPYRRYRSGKLVVSG